jgi:phosphomannomutase
MEKTLSCFKAYDIRGRVPDELDENLAYAIAQAFGAHLGPKRVVVGHDIRLSSPPLSAALISGFLEAGIDVVDLGLCGTEEIYFAVSHLGADGGVMVTASHNPAEYNGMKLVREQSKPISGDTGLKDIERLAAAGFRVMAETKGSLARLDNKGAYVAHLLTYVDVQRLKPFTIVADPGNGCAGPIIALLQKKLPMHFVQIQAEPDGTFPNGVPNPLLPGNREVTRRAVLEQGADLGIAWDGDFDRCFLFDEQGGFIEGYYMVGLLAKAVLANEPGAKIIHDPRLVWNTREIVMGAGGQPVMSKTGHAFIKERMRAENAAYGGEMSAHHYFRDFAFCDSGMIPWLLATAILSKSGRPLSELVVEMQAAFPVSGEINSRVGDPDGAIRKVEDFYQAIPARRDYTDGFSLEAADFRFNIRKSNTEPVLRLNVETRANPRLLEEKTAELLGLIRG